MNLLENDYWDDWYQVEGVPLCGVFGEDDCVNELDDMELCGSCEIDQEDTFDGCACCEWDSKAEDDLYYEDDEFVETAEEMAERTYEPPCTSWPCLPVTPESMRAHHEEMKTRNIPVRLDPEEWAKAHAKVRGAFDRFEQSQSSYFESIAEPEHNDEDVEESTPAMTAPTVESSSSSSMELPVSAWEPLEEQPVSHEAPWEVKVIKKKNKSKLSPNQRRAAARKPKRKQDNLLAVITEDGAEEAVCLAGQEWERIELTVDSGAAETICPVSIAPSVNTQPGIKTAQGVKYTCAGGRKLPNLGEKRCMLSTNDSATQRGLTMQVADVNRALLSVSKSVDAGNRVVFDRDWSFIEDRQTGERTTLTRQGGLYVLEAWVKPKPDIRDQPAMPFGRQGSRR